MAEAECDIVVLQHNRADLTRRLIRSIRDAASGVAYRLILVDNGSDWKEFDAARREMLTEGLFVRHESNLGFVAGTNSGLQLSGKPLVAQIEQRPAPFVALCENDTYFTEQGTLRRMLDYAKGENVAMVAPRLSACDTGQTCEPGEGTVERRMLSTACCVIPRPALDRVGLLDPAFGAGYGADDDWCIRARLAGFRLLLALDCFAHHDRHQTQQAVIGLDGIDADGAQGLALLQERYGSVDA